MPRRELKYPQQIEDWLNELSSQISRPARMILIGSGALLWHAFRQKVTEPLPENSMDVDPITDSDEKDEMPWLNLHQKTWSGVATQITRILRVSSMGGGCGVCQK